MGLSCGLYPHARGRGGSGMEVLGLMKHVRAWPVSCMLRLFSKCTFIVEDTAHFNLHSHTPASWPPDLSSEAETPRLRGGRGRPGLQEAGSVRSGAPSQVCLLASWPFLSEGLRPRTPEQVLAA